MRSRVIRPAALLSVIIFAPLVTVAAPQYQIIRLGDLGQDSFTKSAWSVPTGVTALGLVVGGVSQYTDAGAAQGSYAARWDSSGTLSPIPSAGVNAKGYPQANALGVNDSGTLVGQVELATGFHAVRWAAGSNTPTFLNPLGTDVGGNSDSMAYAINNAGTAVGYSFSYAPGDRGQRPVRWEAGSTDPTKLQPISLDPSTNSGAAVAYSVNSGGTAIGISLDFIAPFVARTRPVKWLANSTSPTPLQLLNGVPTLTDNGNAWGINDAGVIVGSQSGQNKVPLLWDASGGIHQLGRTLASGTTLTGGEAFDINNSGVTVGQLGGQAVIWDAAGNPTQLIDLIDPNSGWKLFEAKAINDAGWIVGAGTFGPAAPTAFNTEGFLLIPVPEPTSAAVVFASTLPGVLRARRRR